MKKAILIFSLGLFSVTANAQMVLQSGGSSTLSFRKSPNFKDAEASGSKYFKESYQNARVNKGDQNFLVRYNAYSDIMEYNNGSDMLDLIKEKNTHFVFQDGSIYELFTYTTKGESLERYHQVVVDNNDVKISKFRSIELIPGKKATNSYDVDTQPAYKAKEEVYYITVNNVTSEFDGKQKSLVNLFPGKEEAIKAFYKNNRIKENDSDMIKLGNFLATL